MLLADSFQDPERARVIYMAAGGLVLIALLVIAGTVWWWRSAAVEHPSLGPLEVMGTRSWWNGDDTTRREIVDSVRPIGAEPGDTSLIVPDPVDLLETDRTRPIGFDDLLADEENDDDWKHEDRKGGAPKIGAPKIGAPKDTRTITTRTVPMDPLLRPNDDY